MYSFSPIRKAKNLTDLKAKLKKIPSGVSRIYIIGTMHKVHITRYQPGKIFIGCIGKTRAQWLAMSEKYSDNKKYKTKTRKEYERYVKLLSSIKLK